MDFPKLASNIQTAHYALQQNAMRAINQNITARNWLVGYWIVEFEQNGEDRAKYGEKLLATLAKTIKIKGLGRSTLNLCRLFYKNYPDLGFEIRKYLFSQQNQPIIQSLIGKTRTSDSQYNTIIQSVIGKSENNETTVIEKPVTIPKVSNDKIFKNLSFTHIIPLLSIEDPLKRSFYEIEAIKGSWSVRELHRQIRTCLFPSTCCNCLQKKRLLNF